MISETALSLLFYSFHYLLYKHIRYSISNNQYPIYSILYSVYYILYIEYILYRVYTIYRVCLLLSKLRLQISIPVFSAQPHSLPGHYSAPACHPACHPARTACPHCHPAVFKGVNKRISQFSISQFHSQIL